MAVNRFFKPVDYEYTPIPFQELVTLGKYYADERKQAEKDLATYIQKANEFTSLLSKDVDTYNKTAFTPQVKQYIQQAASNPSVMRDMSWRSGLQAAINSVDYGMLNKLKSSAESAKLYDAAAKKLAIEGKLPPGWEPNYFDTYSTAESGVFNENPLPYQTKTDIVKPYLDNLKDSYLWTEKGYDYYGVDAATIANQLKVFESDILNNPTNQREIQRYVQRGMSLEDATDFVLRQVNTAGLEFMRSTRTINPIYEIDKKAEVAARKAGIGAYGNNTYLFTQSAVQNARKKASAAADDYLRAVYPEKYKTIEEGLGVNATAEQKAAAEQAKKELQEVRKNTTDDDIRCAVYEEGARYGGLFEPGKAVSTSCAITAAHQFMNVYGGTVLGGDDNEILNNSIYGISDERENGNRTVQGVTNLTLLPIFAANAVGEEIEENSPLHEINDAIRSGKLGKLEITGAGGMMEFPSGSDSSINYGYVNVSVSEDALINANVVDIYSTGAITNFVSAFKEKNERAPKLNEIPEHLKKQGLDHVLNGIAVKVTDSPSINKSKTTVAGSNNSSDSDSKNNKKTTTTVSGKKPKTTYNFIMTYPLPSHHGGVAAESLNAAIAKSRKGSAEAAKEDVINYIMSNLYD